MAVDFRSMSVEERKQFAAQLDAGIHGGNSREGSGVFS